MTNILLKWRGHKCLIITIKKSNYSRCDFGFGSLLHALKKFCQTGITRLFLVHENEGDVTVLRIYITIQIYMRINITTIKRLIIYAQFICRIGYTYLPPFRSMLTLNNVAPG